MELETTLEGLREVEATLRRTEEKYRSIFEEAIEGVFQTSVDGRFLSANPSLAHVHGYASPQELIDSITEYQSSCMSIRKTGPAAWKR